MSNELVVIENVELVPFFTKGEKLDSILEQIEKEMLAFVPGDLSVKKNRDAVKAMVTKVVSSKTYLEKNGKELAAEYKEIPKQIDANRKKTKDFLTELQAKVRQPLTDWEEEQKRIEAENVAAEEAEKLRVQVESDHEIALLMNEKFDRDIAEKLAEAVRIEKERQEVLKRVQEEREAKIAQEAKEKAGLEAKQREEKLESDRLAAIEREEQAKRDAIAAEERRKAQAEEAERQRVIAAEKAKQDAIDAENKRLADVEQAKRDEKARQERDIEKARIVQEQNKAKVEHSRKIHQDMVAAFVVAGLGDDEAKLAVTALVNSAIPHIGNVIY